MKDKPKQNFIIVLMLIAIMTGAIAGGLPLIFR
jgi:hypothetical protein